MIYLLDTNILIYLIKKKPPQVADRIDALREEDQLAMSFVTWAELLQGAAGSFPKAQGSASQPRSWPAGAANPKARHWHQAAGSALGAAVQY